MKSLLPFPVSHLCESGFSAMTATNTRFQRRHKQHTWGVTVSCHSQMGPSRCRRTSSGLPLILHYGEWYNHFIIYHNVVIIEKKCTINVMCWNHPQTTLPSSSMKSVPAAKKVGDHCVKGKKSVTKKTTHSIIPSCEMSRVSNSVETESRLVDA